MENYPKRRLKRQPRAKAMLPQIRDMITFAAISTKEKREVLAPELIARIQLKYPKEIPPVEETVIKLISRARNQNISPLDRPWSLAVLNHLDESGISDISADAIEYIMKVQYYLNHDFRESWSRGLKVKLKQGHPEIDHALITDELVAKAQGEYPVLTIRQAKWAARLFRLQSNIHRLYYTALLYSNYEIVSEISGTTFNSEILDNALFNWSDFSDLIGEYWNASQFDDNLSKASKRSFKTQVNDEGEE